MFYWTVRFILLVIFKIFFGIKVEGREFIPKEGSFILASNHLSNIDPPVLAVACRRQLNFLAKEELFRNKFFSWLIRKLNAFPLKRQQTDLFAMRQAIKILRGGKAVLIFPQGTRGAAPDKALGGIGFLFKKTAAPVILAKLTGTDKILPKGAKAFKRHSVKVVFEKITAPSKNESYEQFARRVVEKIRDM
ncbi:MAG: lysophospholipid acyltransferase family protein [Candidatus Omnitrophota bacterium]